MSPETSGRNLNPVAHLSEFELDEVLLGDPSLVALAHLADCEQCSTRIDAVAQPIASFREVSLAWSERRSATLPLRGENFGRATAAPPRLPGWMRRHGWLAATAGVVAVMLAVPMHFRDRQPDVQPQALTTGTADAATPAATAASGPAVVLPPQSSSNALRRQQQIEADNQMLADIDQELDASQAKLAAYGLNISGVSDVSPARSRNRNHAGAPTQE